VRPITRSSSNCSFAKARFSSLSSRADMKTSCPLKGLYQGQFLGLFWTENSKNLLYFSVYKKTHNVNFFWNIMRTLCESANIAKWPKIMKITYAISP
jgi:hypothetical protein